MATDDHTRAPNARIESRVVYDVDPRGWGMFTALNGALNRGLTQQRAVVTRPMFGGWAQAPQKFRGAASLGVARPVTPKAGEMSDQITTSLADPITAAFLARES